VWCISVNMGVWRWFVIYKKPSKGQPTHEIHFGGYSQKKTPRAACLNKHISVTKPLSFLLNWLKPSNHFLCGNWVTFSSREQSGQAGTNLRYKPKKGHPVFLPEATWLHLNNVHMISIKKKLKKDKRIIHQCLWGTVESLSTATQEQYNAPRCTPPVPLGLGYNYLYKGKPSWEYGNVPATSNSSVSEFLEVAGASFLRSYWVWQVNELTSTFSDLVLGSQ
jgi:hypothetical protein